MDTTTTTTETQPLTQEALLDLIEEYAVARSDVMAAAMFGKPAPTAEMQTAFAALLDAVRSLPIEAGR